MLVRRTSVATATIVVVGGGIIGCAVAQRLARLGQDVLLVEAKGAPGEGSSGRCDGNVLLQTKTDRLLISLTRKSIGQYRQWADEFEIDIQFEQRGSLVFCTDDDQVVDAGRRVGDLATLGISAELIANEALRKLEPHLVEWLPVAIQCHDDAEVYPPAVVAALTMDARRHGCRVLYGAAAQELVLDRSGDVIGLMTSAGLVSTPRVVNAMGVWATQLRVPAAVPPVPLRPRQGVLVVTEESDLIRHNIREAGYMSDRSDGDPSNGLRVAFSAEPTYRGNLLIGSSRRFTGFDECVDPAIVWAVMRRAMHFVPSLSQAQVIRTFAGLRPWTPDGKPIVGQCASTPGYFLATGHEGEGIGLAPATADLVAASVLGTNTAEDSAALYAFSPDRFDGPDGVG